MNMSATKATAGGAAGALVILVMYLLNQIGFIASMPAEPKGALTFLVSAGIGYGLVYWAPPNRKYAEEPPEQAPDNDEGGGLTVTR